MDLLIEKKIDPIVDLELTKSTDQSKDKRKDDDQRSCRSKP